MASMAFPLTVAQKQLIMFVKPLPPQELSGWGRKYQEAGQFHDVLSLNSQVQIAAQLVKQKKPWQLWVLTRVELHSGTRLPGEAISSGV